MKKFMIDEEKDFLFTLEEIRESIIRDVSEQEATRVCAILDLLRIGESYTSDHGLEILFVSETAFPLPKFPFHSLN